MLTRITGVILGVLGVLGITVALSAFGAVPSAADEAPEGQSVFGKLQDADRKPIADVTITVSDSGGNVVEEVVSNAQGQWEVPVESAGAYTVELDESTLPEGINLQNPDLNPLEINVLSGQDRAALFQLGTGEPGEDGGGGGPSTSSDRGFAEDVLRALANGIKVGLILAMASVGLSLIFGTTGLINFAHGELVAMGAMFAWWLNAEGPHWHLLLAGLIAVIATGAFGAGLERGLLRPLRHRRVGLIQVFIITIGLSLAIRHLLLVLFGGRPRAYVDFVGQQPLEIGPITLTPRDLVITIASALVLVAVAVVLQATKVGKAVRAVRDNPALASASGIDVDRIILIVWTSGAALAAIGGIFWGSAFTAQWDVGFRILLLMFAAVILGGIGTAYGAMAGGLVIGIVTEVSTLWAPPELRVMWGLVVLILVLLVRPQGILGRAERVG